MKNTKILALALGSLVALASSAFATTVTIKYDSPGYATSSYTEVNVSGSDLAWLLDNYIPGLNATETSIGSFCLETGEHVEKGQPVDAVLNNKAINGGVGAAGDPISVGTALLVKRFASGSLDNIGVGFSYHDAISVTKLQAAIWTLENEHFAGVYSPYKTEGTNSLLAYVASEFGTLAGAKADYLGNQVKVLNVTTGGGQILLQDQVVYVPDASSTIALLGVGLLGLAALRRRNA